MRTSLQYLMSRFQSLAVMVVVCLYFGNLNAQYQIPKKPSFQTSVYDFVNLLSADEKSKLEQKLIRYSDTTSTQIVVITIPSTEGEDINYLAANWGQDWGIGGSAETDNGVLILLAKNDRRIAIATGYGVEYLLTDALSKRIIERDIIPYFKQNDYPGGLNRGTDAIFGVLIGEYKGTRQSQSTGFPIEIVFFLVFFIIIFILAITKHKGGGKGGNRGNTFNSGSLLDAIILSNMGRGSYRRSSSSGGFGGFGGGSSGGGFGGGFGGGGFGGGGASGGW